MSRHGHATQGKSDAEVANVVTEDIAGRDQQDVFQAKKEVLRLLKSRPDVNTHVGAPQDASDRELLTALARTDSPRGTLRAAGYDANSANQAAELLPDALVAANSEEPRRSYRPHWWKCCVCAGILFFIAGGLLFGYLHFSVFSKADWMLGTCNLVGFSNRSCTSDCTFDVNIKQVGKGQQQLMRFWAPDRDVDRRNNKIVFVGDAFRCCDSENWDCCAFLDTTTMYFCDNWPYRNAPDGSTCPGGDWACLFQLDTYDENLVTELKPDIEEPVKDQILAASIVFWCFCCCAATSCFWEPYLLNKDRKKIPEVDPASVKKPSVKEEAKKRQSIGTIHKIYKVKTAKLQDELKAAAMEADAAPSAAPDQAAPDLEAGADKGTGRPSSADRPSSAGRKGLQASLQSGSRRPSNATTGSERRPSNISASDAPTASERRPSKLEAPMPQARPSSAQQARRPSVASETVRPASALPTVSEVPENPQRPASASTTTSRRSAKSTPPVRPGSAVTTGTPTTATEVSLVLDPLSENEPPDFGGDMLKKLAAEHNKKEFFRPIIDPLDFNSQVARRAARSGSAPAGRTKSAQQRRLRAQTPHPMSAQSELWGGQVHPNSRGGLRPQTAVSRADDPRNWAWADQGQFDGQHVVDVSQAPQMSPLRVIASSPTGIMRNVQGTPCDSQTAVRALTQMQAELGDEVSPILLKGNYLDDRPRASHGRRSSGRNSAIASAAVRDTVSRGSNRF